MATMMELAEEIIKGRRITKDDDLSIFLTCDLDELGQVQIRSVNISLVRM